MLAPTQRPGPAADPGMVSDQAFAAVAGLFQRISGIRLPLAKRALVSGRLQRLAHDRGIASLDDYVRQLLQDNDPAELVRVVDKLTTNETYFFREPQHFEHLVGVVGKWSARRVPGSEFRVWSAASSSGEEAYSIAMLLADKIGPRGWQVVGTDLSTAMVEAARRALYPMERARHVKPDYLRRFCRKGEGTYAGRMLVSRELRESVRFGTANLMETLPDIGEFDVVFLRNVLIYFEPREKAVIVRRVLERLRPGGLLYTGHAESLNGLELPLRPLQPAVYAVV